MRERGERHRVPPATRAGLLALGLYGALAAAPAAAQRLPFNRFTADDGLAATQIWDILQDRRGYLWVATTWGLCRWDGERFTTLSVPEGLPSPNVRSLVEDERGRLWIGTNDGLAVYDGHRIESVTGLGDLQRGTVWAAERDASGRLWFGTDRGLLLFDGHGFRAFRSADGLADDYVYSLHAARDGSLWVGSRGGGVAHCGLAADGALAACRVFRAEDGLGSGVVRAIAEDGAGRIYLATRGAGLTVYEGGALRRFGVAQGLPGDDLYALLVDSAGELLIGFASGGVAVCALPDLEHCRRWTEANGLPDDGVRVLVEDRERTLWLGTEGGLSSLARRDLWSYGESEGLPDSQVYAVAADPAGGLWVGTFEGLGHLGLGANGEPDAESFRGDTHLPSNWIWALAAPRAGELWIGTEAGLCRRVAGRDSCELYTRAQGLPSDYVYGLYFDRGGDLWVGTTEGLARLRNARAAGVRPVEAFRVADGLAANRCYAMAQDSEGRLWVVHGEGLSWWDGRRFHAVLPSPGLPLPAVRSLGTGPEGTLWVGGYGHVSRRVEMTPDGPRFERFAVEAGGEAALVLSISEAEHGHLLLGTNRGVLLFDPAARAGRGQTLARFAHGAGLIATEVSHSSAFARDASGRSWFGFKGGLTGLPVELEVAPPSPPMVAFERLESTRGWVYRAPFSAVDSGARSLWLGQDEPRLPAGDRGLRVTARALTFRRESGVRYQFRLESVDDDWPPPQSEPFRDFTNLDPGRHRVWARAAAGVGAWGAPIELALEIRPTLWQTTPFRTAAALLGVGLLAAAVTLRTRSIARRARDLERQVAERTDDLARYAQALAEHLSALDRGNQRARDTDRQRRDLLAQLSHEVRTPLTSILGFSELLESAAAPRLTVRELRYLGNVRESGNHLLRLVNNLLDQAKLDAGRMEVHFERVDLGAVVASVVSLMEGFAVVREVRLESRAAPDLPPVEVDLAKLRQVLLNLISNAIKFSPSGGLVEIEAGALAAGDCLLGVPAFEVAVRDAGPGIRAEDLSAIFEPFRQLDDRGGRLPGTGLGLPIARQLTRLMGGDIAAESEPGRGSIFRVLLPQAAAPPAPAVERAEPAEADRPRVLIIDPDRAGFAELAHDLELGGFLAVRAPDVEEARRMVPELRPAAVAIELDPARPEAWRAAASLERELLREQVALVLLARVAGGRAAWAIGFDRVLPAGVSVEELVDALVELGVAARADARPGVVLVGGSEANALRRSHAVAEAGLQPTIARDARSARAAFADGRLAAVVVDAEEPLAGGFALLREGQAEGHGGVLAWVLIAPEELSAPARHLYTEEVASAPEPAAAALATAVADAARRRDRRRRSPRAARPAP